MVTLAPFRPTTSDSKTCSERRKRPVDLKIGLISGFSGNCKTGLP